MLVHSCAQVRAQLCTSIGQAGHACAQLCTELCTFVYKHVGAAQSCGAAVPQAIGPAFYTAGQAPATAAQPPVEAPATTLAMSHTVATAPAAAPPQTAAPAAPTQQPAPKAPPPLLRWH